MSHEARSAAADLTRLRAEIGDDRAAMQERAGELRALLSRWKQSSQERGSQVLTAYCVHGWYTGLETILERVARTIDRQVPSGPRAHAELVSQAMTELPGVRPEILPRVLLPELLKLLGFRHFFRHAYGPELDSIRLELEAQRLIAIEPDVARALDAWDLFLGSTLERLAVT